MSEIANVDMRNYWNGDGGHNWLRFQGRIEASLSSFGQQAMEAAAIVSGERILDIGCGCGDTSYELARRVGPRGHVHGIDISEIILRKAQTRTSAVPHNNISFECVDAQSFDFGSIAFDIAFSRFGVMFFDDPVAAFSNTRKALQSGGRFVFTCWQALDDNQWVNLPLQVASNHVAVQMSSDPEESGPFSLADAHRVERILAEAGFGDISIKHFQTSFNVGANLEEAVILLTNIGPASSVIMGVDVSELSRNRMASELRDCLRQYKTVNGVELDAAAWIVTAANP